MVSPEQSDAVLADGLLRHLGTAVRMAQATASAAHRIETVHGFGYRLTLPKTHRGKEMASISDTAHEDEST